MISQVLLRASSCWEKIRRQAPLVHCIVSPVAMRDCANFLLASGARPLMAQAPEEVEEIACRTDALLLNTGTLSQSSARSMRLAGDISRERGIPIVLDAVGVGLSKLRTDLCHDLIKEAAPCIVKGNASEIRWLLYRDSAATGVDAAPGEEVDPVMLADAAAFAGIFHTVLLITGMVDYIVSDTGWTSVVGGHPLLGSVTATGCVAGALSAGLCTVGRPREAALAAVCAMDLAGEKAGTFTQKNYLGTGSFSMHLLDQVYLLDPAELLGREEYLHEHSL